MRHIDSRYGTNPAIVQGAIQKNTNDPNTAPTVLVTLLLPHHVSVFAERRGEADPLLVVTDGAPGEAPERRHPSTHRLCGGKQIQHLPETTAGAPVIVKGLLAHLGRLVEHEGRGLVAKALGSRFWGHTTLPVGPSRKPGPTE